MATEKHPWLNKYSASVAAGLTVAALTAIVGARHFYPDAFAALTGHLTEAGQFLAAPVSIVRWLLWSLYAVATIEGAILLFFAFTVIFELPDPPPWRVKTALIDDVNWQWTISAGDFSSLTPLCPRELCNNELDIFVTQNSHPKFQEGWPDHVTELSCNRCNFRALIGVDPDRLLQRIKREIRRRYRNKEIT